MVIMLLLQDCIWAKNYAYESRMKRTKYIFSCRINKVFLSHQAPSEQNTNSLV